MTKTRLVVKRILAISILFISMFTCTNKDMDVQNSIVAETIAGNWKLVAEEQGFIGQSQSTWSAVKQDSTYNIGFLPNGVLLDFKGIPACCAPTSLTINGTFYEVKPSGGQLAPNPDCAKVNCSYCPIWEIKLTGNEMIVGTCNSARKKYQRI
jgi:hypothetical protein